MQSAQRRQLEALQRMMLAQQSNVLVEFKAGKLTLSGTTVTADKARGTLSLVESAVDGQTRMQWRTRPTEQKDPEVLVTPSKFSVEKVPECKDGRVILVRDKTRTPERKLFFWMQEPKADKDDEIIESMKKAFQNARAPRGSPESGLFGDMAGALGGGAAGDDAKGLQDALQASMQEFLRTQGGAGAAGPAGSAGAGAAGAAGGAGAMAMAQARQMQAKSLQNVVQQSDLIIDSLDEKARQELYEFLPAGQQNEKGLLEALRSAQLQQGAAQLNRVLNSAQYGNIAVSFGLDNTGEIGSTAFINAINAKFKPNEEAKGNDADEEKDGGADGGSK